MNEVNNNEGASRSAGMNAGLYLAIGWIAAIISLVRYPFIFGVVGVIMGILVNKSEKKSGVPLIAASILFMAIGLIFSDIIFSFLKRTFGI